MNWKQELATLLGSIPHGPARAEHTETPMVAYTSEDIADQAFFARSGLKDVESIVRIADVPATGDPEYVAQMYDPSDPYSGQFVAVSLHPFDFEGANKTLAELLVLVINHADEIKAMLGESA